MVTQVRYDALYYNDFLRYVSSDVTSCALQV